MTDLLELQKSFLLRHIKEGDTVADFTMGNGHDTLWLSDTVGGGGRVYAFDIQRQAVDSTRELLNREAKYDNCTLILDSHSECDKYINTPIKAGVFNLGYLPGSDKKVTTLRHTTRIAVEKAINMLDSDGILLIAVYPGHEEGTVEGNMLAEMLAEYNRRKYCCACFRILNSPISPFFYTIESK